MQESVVEARVRHPLNSQPAGNSGNRDANAVPEIHEPTIKTKHLGYQDQHNVAGRRRADHARTARGKPKNE